MRRSLMFAAARLRAVTCIDAHSPFVEWTGSWDTCEPSYEAIFILRERMRTEGVMYTRMHHVLERCAQVEGDRVREGQPMSIAHYRKVMRLITEVVT